MDKLTVFDIVKFHYKDSVELIILSNSMYRIPFIPHCNRISKEFPPFIPDHEFRILPSKET